MEKKRIAFELNKTLYQQIETLAQIFHTSVSTVTRQALQAYVDANKVKLDAAPPIPERPRKLSQAEMEAAWAEENAKAREAWLRENE